MTAQQPTRTVAVLSRAAERAVVFAGVDAVANGVGEVARFVKPRRAAVRRLARAVHRVVHGVVA